MVEVQSATAEKNALCVKNLLTLRFIIQHICCYLVKPALILKEKKTDKSGNYIWI